MQCRRCWQLASDGAHYDAHARDNRSMSAAVSQTAAALLEHIIGADATVLMVETAEADSLVEHFARLTRRRGQALYQWRPDCGLLSMREGEMTVPGCQRLGDVLRHVLASVHFGIYLLHGLDVPLAAPARALLQQIARARTEHLRRVVLLGTDTGMVDTIKGAVVVRESEHARVRPRLRDGRWVV